MTTKPAVGLVAVAGRRRVMLEVAQRFEREGFAGLYCPSPGDGLALCEALALSTHEIPFGTSIANIYTRHPLEYAQMAAFIHELSNGRFRFGIGVSHGPTHARLGIRAGTPLDDVRKFVADLRTHATQVGGLPPIGLASRSPGVGAAGPRVLHRQHGADLHRRGSRRCGGALAPDSRPLRAPAELPELLDRGGL